MARPSIYTKELGDEICTRLASGLSLRKICSADDMPAISSVLLWVVDGKHPEFSEQYRAGREANGQAHGDRIADLADKVLDGEYDPQSAKVAIDALKWSAERMAPKQYGPKQQLEHTGKDGGAIEVKEQPVSDRDLARRIAFILTKATQADSTSN